MAIITISRGSHSHGKEIAEKVAQKLGYECIAREILIEAADQFNIPEVKLIKALENAPTMRNSFTYGREKYVSFIEEAFLAHVQKDNVVYHGLAGHFFLKDIEHALKVRIIADIEDRVHLEIERKQEAAGPTPPDQPVEREDLGGFSRFMKKLENVMAAAGVAAEGDADSAKKIDPAPPEDPRELIKREDEKRRQWSLALYGIDTADPSLYDLVVHVRKLTVDDAADIICHAVDRPQFATTPESQLALDDLVLAARAKAVIVNTWPGVRVTAHHGAIVVHTQATMVQEPEVRRRITEVARNVKGVTDVRVHVDLITS
jgi:cytidylate kinase